MKYKTILFDLDDTLVVERAAESASFLAACECVREFGKNPEDASTAVQETARKKWEALPVWPWCDSIGISPWEGLWGDFSGEGEQLAFLRSAIDEYRSEVWHEALGGFGVLNTETVRKAERKYRQERSRRHEVYPGVHETLKAHLEHRFTLVMLTNGAPRVQREKIERSGLDGYFHHTIISGELGVGKPDRRIFEHALELTGAKPKQTLMVGDSLIRDIAGAGKCGITTVWAAFVDPITLYNDYVRYIIWYFSALREITGAL